MQREKNRGSFTCARTMRAREGYIGIFPCTKKYPIT